MDQMINSSLLVIQKKWQIYHSEKNINKSFHIIAFTPKAKQIEPIKVFKILKKNA